MSLKASGPGESLTEIDRWEGGVGWIAHPEEGIERASHALAVDGEVWVVEPVDAVGLDDLLAEFGEVAGVVVGLGRHERDAVTVAERHDVAVHVPSWMSGAVDDADAPVELLGRELADTGYQVRPVVNSALWREALLYHPDRDTLVVPEAVGTADHYLADGERLGVHPALRVRPPKDLRRYEPERILVGHGAGVHEDAGAALRDALAGARRRIPGLYLKNFRNLAFG